MADARSREDLAWCAGFYDGEGHIAFRFRENGGKTGKRWRRIAIQITQVDREVLDRFRRVMGVGSIGGPYLPACSGPNRSPHFKYSADGFHHAQAVIAFMWPFLGSIKREQARVALRAFIEGCDPLG